MDYDLTSRLRAAGVDPDRIPDPAEAYRALFEYFGERATLLDRYQLEEHHHQFSINDSGRTDSDLVGGSGGQISWNGSRGLSMGTRSCAFRDLLRSDPRTAAAYAELKRGLAITYEEDRIAYNEGKTGFILDALDSK